MCLKRVLTVAVVGVVTVMTGAVSGGCGAGKGKSAGEGKGKASASVKASADPARQLSDAVHQLDKIGYHFTYAINSTDSNNGANGEVDPVGKKGQVTVIHEDLQTKAVVVGSDKWLSVQSGWDEPGTPWFHLVADQLPNGSPFIDVYLGRKIAAVLDPPVTAVSKGAGRFEGTVVLAGDLGNPFSLHATPSAAASAAPVPFTALVDNKGRLRDLTVNVPATADRPAASVAIEFGSLGIDPGVTPPSGAVPAPDKLYALLRLTR